jgi:uncharacterized protein YbjT (DUF2867 family)
MNVMTVYKIDTSKPIFVTGASGYIGGRLVPRLLDAGYHVRCLARSPRKLESRAWASSPRVQIVTGDVEDTEALTESMRGCSAAFYLVHSMMASGEEYAEQDRRLATGFARAAAAADIERILYLGGLGETGQRLSEHLTSRREVEQALASATVPVTVFRAAMIIGSGSASFEILRYLVERLPVMVTPRWVRTENQPIAVRNVLHYLIAALQVPETIGKTLDVGGSDILSYREVMRIMAEELRLPRRVVIPVPVLTPRLSSLWIHLVTPLSSRIARPLAEGLRNRVVCRDDLARHLMPQRLLSVREAIHAALATEQEGHVETSWSDAGVIPGDPDWAGGASFVHSEVTPVQASPLQVFGTVCRIGGRNGWYAADFLWKLRGLMDQLIGGPGLRRGRRSATDIQYGDALDFWRVTAIEPSRRLELRAEMKVPGVATLEFLIDSHGEQCRLTQIARFQPRGLLGILYWYAVKPLHGIVFRDMLLAIRRVAEGESENEKNKPSSPLATSRAA